MLQMIDLQLFASEYKNQNTNNPTLSTTDRSVTGSTATTASTGANSNTGTSYQAAQRQSTASNPYTGLNGLNSNTSQQLANYQQGYQASQQVTDAMNYLTNLTNNRPGNYQAKYQDQMDSILNQIGDYSNGNKQFNYDLNADMLYQQYKDQYLQNGKQAMMDTMGNAASLTGGYGSSYGTNAGYQAYQQYLTQLNGAIPDFYDRAYQRYGDDYNRLQNYYGDLASAEATNRQNYDQDYSNYLNSVSSANSVYSTLHNADYGQYSDALSYWQNAANAENANWQYTNSQAYNTAMAMIQAGAMPSTDMLAAAGVSQADAQAYYNALHPAPSGGGSGSVKKKDDSDPNDIAWTLGADVDAGGYGTATFSSANGWTPALASFYYENKYGGGR